MITEPETLNLEPQVFVGDASDAEARVYATLPRAALPEDAQLIGELVGPYCRYSHTLPARIRFVDRGPGPKLLAEAVVPDPCFWTPELPFMYSAELRMVEGKDSARERAALPIMVQRPFGIRRLGAQAASLYLDAKRFVLRGLRRNTAEINDFAAARETGSALFVSQPSDQFLHEASEQGVMLVVDLPRNQTRLPVAGLIDVQQMTTDLERLGRWPAVAIVILDCDVPAGKELRLAARNTLLAQRIKGAGTSTAALCPWAHLLWWQIEAIDAPTAQPQHDIPVIVYRPATKTATIVEGRRACDQLQADLAPLGDFAGYFA